MRLGLHMTHCRQNLLILLACPICPVFYTLLQTISIFSTTADHKLRSFYIYFSCIYGVIIIIIIIIIIVAILFALFRKNYCVKNRFMLDFLDVTSKVRFVNPFIIIDEKTCHTLCVVRKSV